MIVFGVIFAAAFLAVILKEKIEMLIAPMMMVFVMIGYFFMQIGILRIGLFLACLIGVASTLAVIGQCFVDFQIIREYVLTYGLGWFVLSIIFFYIFSIGIDLSKSVDAYLWVVTPKLLYYTDDIKMVWSRVPSTHPIFLGMWGYLVEKTWFGWDDAALLASKNIMIFASLLPFYNIIERKMTGKQKAFSSAMATIIIMALPYVSCGVNVNEYSNYGVDVLMGIMIGVGAALFGLASEQDNDLYYLISLCYFTSALQLKRIAVVLIVLNFIWIFMTLLIKKRYKTCILYLIVPALAYFISMGASLYLAGLPGAFLAGFLLYFLVFKKAKKDIAIILLALGVVGFGIAVWTWMNSDEYVFKMTQAFCFNMISNENYYIGGFIKLSALE